MMYAAALAIPESAECRMSSNWGQTLEKNSSGVIPFGTADSSRDALDRASVDSWPGGCELPFPAELERNNSNIL